MWIRSSCLAGTPNFVAEQVPAPPAPNKVLNVNVAPALEPVLAVPVAQVENSLPAAANNVAHNTAPEVNNPNFNI